MTSFSLRRLIYPSEPSAYLRDTWGLRCSFHSRALGEDAPQILTLASFEQLLASLNRPHEGWLHFARGGLGLVPADMVDAQGMLDLRKLRSAFADGDTLYLTKAERVCEPLRLLARAVQVELAAAGIRLREAVSAHVFLTPPGAQGFAAHRDAHASFVIQLDGVKQWRVYEPAADSAAQSRRAIHPGTMDRERLASMPMQEFELRPGDVLYMPEWRPHEAHTSSSHSLHVTLRMFPLRWADALDAILAEHPLLAAAASNDATDDAGALKRALLDVLRSPAFAGPLDGLLEEFLWRNGVPETALPNNGLQQMLELDEVGIETRLIRAPLNFCSVHSNGAEACIRFPGGVIRGPIVIKGVFDYVAGVTELRPADLPELEESDYDRVEVARTMVRDGLLQVAARQT